MIAIVSGSRAYTKTAILDHCFKNFEQTQIWLIDSRQVFDPYYLSRRDKARARRLLQSLEISRPFTFYQLRDRILGLRSLPIKEQTTIIISSIDTFDDDIENEEEKSILLRSMIREIGHIHDERGCDMIIGAKKSETAIALQKTWGCKLWAEL